MMYLLITALLLIGPAFAQVSQQSDGQHYGGGETTITWEQSSSMETALFSSLAITEGLSAMQGVLQGKQHDNLLLT